MQSHQQRMAAQRGVEQQREDQTKRINKDREMQAMLKNEENLEKKIYLRKFQHELTESQIEDSLQKAEEERIKMAKQFEQEERNTQEASHINHEKLRDEKIRQYIRVNSIEHRELESKLKSAYLNKGRAAQIAEKEAVRFETMREEADFADKMKKEQERVSVEQEKLERKQHEVSRWYQKELEQQLMEKDRRRQEAYKEFLNEKLLVDEIVRKIYEEDWKERQLKLEKVTADQRDIEEFKRQQAECRCTERAKMEAENRRIMEFANYKQQMEESSVAKRLARKQAKQHVHRMLAEKMEIKAKQCEELERIREELCTEEQAEADRQSEIELMEKKIRERLMLQQTNQEQMEMRDIQKRLEKEEDEAFRQTMMAKLAEDDRIDQMNARKRRAMQLEHKQALQKLTEDRRRQREADKELEAKERAAEQEREALRRQIIEEERQRLLKHHATKLLGYFPKGLFHVDDLQHFDEEFRSNFQKRPADMFSAEGWEDDE